MGKHLFWYSDLARIVRVVEPQRPPTLAGRLAEMGAISEVQLRAAEDLLTWYLDSPSVQLPAFFLQRLSYQYARLLVRLLADATIEVRQGVLGILAGPEKSEPKPAEAESEAD